MPPRKRTRLTERRLTDVAVVLYGAFLVVVLLIGLPAVGVIEPVVPVGVLRILSMGALLLLIVVLVAFAAVVVDEAWLALRWWRIRRRRARIHDLTRGGSR